MHDGAMVYRLMLLGALGLAGYGVYLMWRDQYGKAARAFVRRIAAAGQGGGKLPAELSILKAAQPARPGAAGGGDLLGGLTWMLAHGGLGWSLKRFLLYTGGAGLAVALACAALGLPVGLGIVLGAAAAALPYGAVRLRSRQRTAKMEKQLPEVLDMMVSMLGAGHALPTALQLLGSQAPGPVGEEFRLLHDEMSYGAAAEDALQHMAERTRSDDIRCLVMAILVQRETGGNLTEVLASLAGVVRERLKLQGKIRALSAEGRMSAWVLTLLPLIVSLAIDLLRPEYLRVFWTDQTGIKLLYLMIAMLVVGNAWMRKITHMRV